MDFVYDAQNDTPKNKNVKLLEQLTGALDRYRRDKQNNFLVEAATHAHSLEMADATLFG